MIKLFEAFTEEELYPDVFNNQLFRGCNTDKIRFIDDPLNRGIGVGIKYNEKQRLMAKNYVKLGCQNAVTSVHMYAKPCRTTINLTKDSYGKGNLFNVIPQKGAKFTVANRLSKYPIWTPIFSGFGDLVKSNEDEAFLKYQKKVLESGSLFNLSYDELIEWLKEPNEDGIQFNVWTEFPCLLIKIKE